ncbi:hypothetical protein MSG28_009070 [Choristoneura fumiferana]|uniref:Uncharacterized protein n=1 Tax=Choristoneura fumiferana TaxID=7141 RepID=A0ACC0KWP5_CHOFU|nr:hypothetical protein MSG28_009070 [Choristoneura fumiferana]
MVVAIRTDLAQGPTTCKNEQSIDRSGGPNTSGLPHYGFARNAPPIGKHGPGGSISPKWYQDQDFLDYVDKKWKNKGKYSPPEIIADAPNAPQIASHIASATENWTEEAPPVPAVLIHPKWYYDTDFLDYVDKKWKKKEKVSVRVRKAPKTFAHDTTGEHVHSGHNSEFQGLGHIVHDTVATVFPLEAFLPRWW